MTYKKKTEPKIIVQTKAPRKIKKKIAKKKIKRKKFQNQENKCMKHQIFNLVYKLGKAPSLLLRGVFIKSRDILSQ